MGKHDNYGENKLSQCNRADFLVSIAHVPLVLLDA